MKRRLLESLGVAMALAVVIGLLQSTTTPVAGQAPSETPWGHPNLEGIWLDVYTTPFERPIEFADREFFSDEERSARDQARMGNPGRNRRGDDGRRDVAGAYNAVYTSAKPAGPRTSLVVDPPTGQLPPLTSEAQQRIALEREWRLMLLRSTETCRISAGGCVDGEYGPSSPRRFNVTPFYNTGRMNRHDGPEDQSLGDRCMSGRTPDLNGFRRIVQGQDSIAIGYDTGQGQGYQRIVNLGGDHPPTVVQLRHGDSRGHWEGNTLVIETTNFSPKFRYRESGEHRRLVERYTPLDEDTLSYEVTVDDPTVWTAPWTVRQDLKRQNGQQNRIYYEPRCHEGNYGLPALLIGSRMDDQAFDEGRGPDPFSLDTATCVTGLQD